MIINFRCIIIDIKDGRDRRHWDHTSNRSAAPFLILAAVLAIAPVAGIPPNRAEAIFPSPCATNSVSERCLPLIILSATTQDKRDSMAASTAMVNAFGIADFTIENSTAGIWTDDQDDKTDSANDQGINMER